MSVAKTLLRNVLSNWIGYVVQVIVTFVMTPYVLASLGQTGYGVWTLAMGLTGYYGLLDLGISSSLAQYLTRYLAVKDTDGFNRTASAGFIALLACGALIVASSLAVALNISRLFHIPRELESQAALVVIITGVSVALQFVFTTYSAVFTALQRFDLSNGIGVLTRLLFAGVAAVSLAMGWGIVGLSIALAISNVVDYAARWIVAKRLLPWMAISMRDVTRRHASELMRFGAWNVAVACSVRVISYTDALVIAAFMPISAVAPFAVAASLRSYFDDVFVRAGQVVFPAAANLDAQGNVQGLRSLYLVSSRLMFLGSVWCGAIGLFWGASFFRLWLGDAFARPQGYPSVALIFWILLVGSMVSCGQRIGYQVLMGTRRMRVLASLFAIEALANIVLSVLLVRRLGLIGVAVGTLVPALLCQGILQPVFVCRLLSVSVKMYCREVLLRPALVLLALSPAVLAAPYRDSLSSWPPFLTGVAVSIVMTAPIVFFAGLRRTERHAALLMPMQKGGIAMLHAIRVEAAKWWRAFLEAIPGEIGCFARQRFYGFIAGEGNRVLSHVMIHHPTGLRMGRRVGISSYCQLNAAGGVVIQDDVVIGPGSFIWSQNHKFNSLDLPISEQGYEMAPVQIDEGAWIGAGAIILPGVRIGRGTVVAAGSVVSRSTEPFSIVAGVPARRIGARSGITHGLTVEQVREHMK